MILAKYKKQIGEGFFAWSLCIALTGTAWMLKGRSPLAWPNVWGVIDWLAWAAIAIAIFQVAGTQLSRELPNRSRLQDALHLLGFFAHWPVLESFVRSPPFESIFTFIPGMRVPTFGW